MIESISISELLQLNNPTIIDIRNVQSYNNNHIPTSINIPVEKILASPNKYLNNSTKYYLYCQQGLSSKKICQILNKMGYHTVNVLGGYEAWILQK